MQVEMLLHNVLYVSYLVPVSRVRPLVPGLLPLSTVGDDQVFISVVAFKSANVRSHFFGFPRFNYNQINIRTYVKDPQTEKQGVYFLFSGITSRFSAFLTSLMGLRWEYAKFVLHISDTNSIEERLWQTKGRWHGDLCIEASTTATSLKELPPFKNAKEAIAYLTGPLVGFYSSNSSIKHLKIWHPTIEPYLATVNTIHLPPLDGLGLLKGDEKPNVMYVPESPFSIFLPPRLMSRRDSRCI